MTSRRDVLLAALPLPPVWVSISAYGRLYGLTRHTVYKLLDQHLLETYCVLGLVRIKNLRPDQHHAAH